MFLITILPAELQIQIFSYLSFSDQILAAQVCNLWCSLLTTSGRLRRSRYCELRLTEPRKSGSFTYRGFRQYPRQDSPSASNPQIHRFLYNKYQCDYSCVRCHKIGVQNYLRGYAFPLSRTPGLANQPPEAFPQLYSNAYLNAILCQSTLQITGYEICFEPCPLEPTRCPTKINLPATHPFFDELVFSPLRKRDIPNEDAKGEKQDEGRTVNVLNLLHLPRVVWQVYPHPSIMTTRISPNTTIRQLISQTWQAIREVYLSKPHPYAEIMEYVRICLRPRAPEDALAADDCELVLRLEVAVGEGYWEKVDRTLVWRGKMPEPGKRVWKSPDLNLYRRIGNHMDRLFTSHNGHESCCKQEHTILHGN